MMNIIIAFQGITPNEKNTRITSDAVNKITKIIIMVVSIASLPNPIAFKPNKTITKNILPTILLISIIGVEGISGKVIRSRAIINKITLIGKSTGSMLETAQKKSINATKLRLVKNISNPMSEMPMNIKKIFALKSLKGLGKGKNKAATKIIAPITLFTIPRITVLKNYLISII